LTQPGPQNVGVRWAMESNAPAWAGRVLDALVDVVRSRSRTGAIRLLRAWTVDGPHGPLLLVRYRDQLGRSLGYRRRLDVPPPLGHEDEEPDLATWLAGWIAVVEVGEPLGTRAEGLTADSEGVLWWGDARDF
jgi:hypothetical protein